jgi:hypothetical protein
MTPEQMRIALATEAGWTPHFNEDRRLFWHPPGQSAARKKEFTLTVPIPNYPEDANAALEIVAMMRERGMHFAGHVTTEPNLPRWSAGFFEHGKATTDVKQRGHAYAETLPLAICEAACKALSI